MFERFTDRARRVVVLAQDEARDLQHNYIGTEHILLGLLGAGGVGGRALERFDMSLAGVREEVKNMVGIGRAPVHGRIPFTPRAKKVLELSLREAVRLGHNYIGTEHILLGVIREGDGVGAQVLRAHAGDLLKVRMAVLDLVPLGEPARGRRWPRRRAVASPLGEPGEVGESRLPLVEPEEPRTTPAAETSLGEALRLAGAQAVGSHHLLLAALADPNTVVSRTLAGLGLDLDQAREALRQADVTGTSDEQPEDAGRRQMLIHVSQDRVTVEASDPVILGLGRAALDALGPPAGEAGQATQAGKAGPASTAKQPAQAGTASTAKQPAEAGKASAAEQAGGAGKGGEEGQAGVIGGELPAAVSLSDVWLALRDSLDDIRRRAAVAAEAGQPTAQGDAAGQGPPAEPKTGTGGP
jgi:ATP-dependent Clp protease ATP-binding subunit ClpA